MNDAAEPMERSAIVQVHLSPPLTDYCKAPIDPEAGHAQHSACSGYVYVYPPIDGCTKVRCTCVWCEHPLQWKGRPPKAGRPRHPGISTKRWSAGLFGAAPQLACISNESKPCDGSLASQQAFAGLDVRSVPEVLVLGVRGQLEQDASSDAPAKRSGAAELCWQVVEAEVHQTGVFRAGAIGAQEKVRREGDLTERFRDWLGRPLARIAVLVGETAKLYTDLYDEERHELYEAKAAAGREEIRMAIGQLLDYRRYIDPSREGLILTVLLPERPTEDLIAFLEFEGLNLVYETEPGLFKREKFPPRR